MHLEGKGKGKDISSMNMCLQTRNVATELLHGETIENYYVTHMLSPLRTIEFCYEHITGFDSLDLPPRPDYFLHISSEIV